MSDRPSQPHVMSLPAGQVTKVSVTYTVKTTAGLRHTFCGLSAMRRLACPQQVQELEALLTVVCEQVLAARPAGSLSALPAGMARVPSPPPASDPDKAAGGGAGCRVLLAAVRDALACPPPAQAAGEAGFLRLRAERARLVLAALGPVLADDGPGMALAREAAALLRAGMAGCPADGYQHSPLAS